MSLEKTAELLVTKTFQFQQETEMRIRNLEDQMYLLISTVKQLASLFCAKLSSQIIINLKKDESTIITTSDKELKESQGEGSKDTIEKKEMRPKPQITLINESNE